MPRVVRPESSSEDEEGAGTSSGRRTKKKSASPQSQTLRQGTRSHLSQSQLSQSQSQRPHHQLFTEEDVARKVADCVVFILAQERKRAPIKKADVLKAVELTGRPKELQDRVFVRARDKLAHIFGMELVESPDQSKKGIFFLLNAVESQGFCVDEAESARLGALFCVLGLLLMSNGHATDQEVISFLRMLGFPKFSPGKEDEEAKNLLLREWGARQQYLDIAKNNFGDTDNPSYTIRWGPRAQVEVKPSRVLLFISHIYGVNPKSFKEQYDRVVKDEGEEALRVEEDED